MNHFHLTIYQLASVCAPWSSRACFQFPTLMTTFTLFCFRVCATVIVCRSTFVLAYLEYVHITLGLYFPAALYWRKLLAWGTVVLSCLLEISSHTVCLQFPNFVSIACKKWPPLVSFAKCHARDLLSPTTLICVIVFSTLIYTTLHDTNTCVPTTVFNST